MKKIYWFLIAGMMMSMPMMAEENLLSNGSFEEYSCNMMGCQFDDWTLPLGGASANTSEIAIPM